MGDPAGDPPRVTHSGDWTVDDVRHWIRLLNTVIKQRRVARLEYVYGDLALAVFAHHVSEYANAVLLILESEVPGTVYPLLRAAFEAHLDVLYLTTSGDFASDGARAYVAARVADHANIGRQRGADAQRGVSWPGFEMPPLRERIRAEADALERTAPGKGALLVDALRLVEAARSMGRHHWTGLNRTELHRAIDRRLNEPAVEALMNGLYGQLSTRSHSGLRLAHYVASAGPGRMIITSRPTSVDPFPLQTIGSILDTTLVALARFFHDNPLTPDQIASGAQPG